jgi:hypothetical protein
MLEMKVGTKNWSMWVSGKHGEHPGNGNCGLMVDF